MTGTTLPRLSAWWIALYVFAAIWLVLLLSLDASRFGPGFFPLLISIVLVPVLARVLVPALVRVLVPALAQVLVPALVQVLVPALAWVLVPVLELVPE